MEKLNFLSPFCISYRKITKKIFLGGPNCTLTFWGYPENTKGGSSTKFCVHVYHISLMAQVKRSRNCETLGSLMKWSRNC